MSTQETNIEEEPMTEKKDKGARPEFDLGEEFIESGGKVFEWYEDGRPKRWLCGHGPKGEPISPKNVEAVEYLNHEGKWEGTNPDEAAVADKKLWPSH